MFLTEDVLESSMESKINFFAGRVLEGATWDLVVPLITVVTQDERLSAITLLDVTP